ncbi:hypothetical protein PspCFBP13506_00840 [Pseudomonas sp. CFBP13506]|uniref:Uncharacterized protein n=1 Tax=Pseudomonas fluorescens TaxID=294 RepID=A0A4Y9TAG5_PSEFL|nr:hypothetical protein E4T65_22090 [Pseudomonas fluorescens]TKJ65363.1 hypothetical protein PspCFBP13506_00840 [Pseudomonas sp. CFBP13506]
MPARAPRDEFVSAPILQLRALLASQDGIFTFTWPCGWFAAPAALSAAAVNEVTAMKHPIRAQMFVQVICLLSVAQLFC